MRACGLLAPVCRVWAELGPSIPAGISPLPEHSSGSSPGSGHVSRGLGLQQAPGAKVFNLLVLLNLPKGREKFQAGPLTRARPVGSPSQQASMEDAHRVGPLSSAPVESPSSVQTPAVSGSGSGTLALWWRAHAAPHPALGAVWLGRGVVEVGPPRAGVGPGLGAGATIILSPLPWRAWPWAAVVSRDVTFQ